LLYNNLEREVVDLIANTREELRTRQDQGELEIGDAEASEEFIRQLQQPRYGMLCAVRGNMREVLLLD
jgi:hypothetical protein